MKNNTRDAIYDLEKLKNFLLLGENGQVYHLIDWEIEGAEAATTAIETSLFGKQKTVNVPAKLGYISKIKTLTAENVGSTWHRYWDFSETDNMSSVNIQGKLARIVKILQADRERFLKMSKELQSFGFIISSMPEIPLEQKIREAKASGALGEVTGEDVGKHTGIL